MKPGSGVLSAPMPSMHPALLGALIGLVLAAFFIFSEYALLSKAATERAKR